MKNKIVSAMLLGMSAVMAASGMTSFASEDTTESSTECVLDTSNTETEAETETEDVTALMMSYASDETLKIADTPVDFTSKLVSLTFEEDVFGKYANDITDFATNSADKTSLYNCEMDVVKKAAELVNGNDQNVIDSMKYAVAGVFEKEFGEDAFPAGRDIRRAILSNSGIDKDYEFAVSTDIASADMIYTAAGGTTGKPKDLFPAEPETETETETEPKTEQKQLYEYVMGMDDITIKAGETIPEPNLVYDTAHVASVVFDTSAVNKDIAGTYKVVFVITGIDGSTMNVEKTCTVTEQETESKPLYEYVYGMEDIEIQVGEDVSVSQITYDEAHVASIVCDTSAVDKNVAGTYKIVFMITGVDGSTVNVEKTCTVTENTALISLRDEMSEKIDKLGENKFTEPEFQEQWKVETDSAKAQINTMNTEEEMQGVIDSLTEKMNTLLSSQQLCIAKQGYVKILHEYRDSMSYETNSLKEMADTAATTAEEKINASTTVDEASSALENGKSEIQRIANQDETVISELKKQAEDKMNAGMDEVTENISIKNNVQKALFKRLNTAEKAKEIESVLNTADRAIADMKAGTTGDMSSIITLMKDLKGIAQDSDTTNVIEKIIAMGAPGYMEEAENRVSDVCNALLSDTNEFAKYLTSRAGQTISGNTKVAAYEQYVSINNGAPDEDLQKTRNAAKAEIQKMLDEVTTSDSSSSERKESLKAEIYTSIDTANSKEEVQTALTNGKAKIKSFAEELKNEDAINTAKENAKKAIEKTVSAQTDANVKSAVSKLAVTAEEKINNAKSADEITNILNTFNADVKAAISKNAADASLAAVKLETITKLNSLSDGVNTQYVTSEMNNIITQAKTNVENATTSEACSKIYTQAKKDYKNAYLVSMRKAYSEKIDALLTSDITDADAITKVKEVISKQKQNLEQATNEETMNKCYELAKTNVEKIVSEISDSNLSTVKANALTKLKNSYTNLNEQQAKILNKYLNDISAAKSEDEVNSLVEKCDAAMKDAGAIKSSTSATDTDLSTAKANAIASLTNMAATTPEARKDDAQKVLSDYVDKINAATTVDQVNQLKADGITALSKYGADANAAKVNPNTSTTINGTTNPSDKTSATSTVKTGDTNMGIIATAGAILATSLIAAFVSMRKFFKR